MCHRSTHINVVNLRQLHTSSRPVNRLLDIYHLQLFCGEPLCSEVVGKKACNALLVKWRRLKRDLQGLQDRWKLEAEYVRGTRHDHTPGSLGTHNDCEAAITHTTYTHKTTSRKACEHQRTLLNPTMPDESVLNFVRIHTATAAQ